MKNKKVNQQEIKDETKTYMLEGMSIGMCIGTSLGVIIGVLTDNIPVCICFGISIGLCIGLILYINKETMISMIIVFIIPLKFFLFLLTILSSHFQIRIYLF